MEVMTKAATIRDACYKYLELPSVLGFEEPLFRHLNREYEQMGFQVQSLYNRYGRRILMAVSNNGFDLTRMLSVHIDRHGLYKILDPNLVYFSPAYDQLRNIEYAAHAIKRINFDKEDFGRTHLTRVCNYFVGEQLVAYHPRTYEALSYARIESSDLCVIDEYLTFELPEFDELGSLEEQIIPISFIQQPGENDHIISGQIDNVLSLTVVKELFQSGVKTTALFTTDEEIGESWRAMERFFLKNGVEPKEILVLDTSPYTEALGCSELQESGSVILRYNDNYAPFNRKLTNLLKSQCDDLSIPYDFKDITLLTAGHDHLGSTELGKLILESNGKYSGTTLQMPTNEYHTNKEFTSLACVDNLYKLLLNYLK